MSFFQAFCFSIQLIDMDLDFILYVMSDRDSESDQLTFFWHWYDSWNSLLILIINSEFCKEIKIISNFLPAFFLIIFWCHKEDVFSDIYNTNIFEMRISNHSFKILWQMIDIALFINPPLYYNPDILNIDIEIECIYTNQNPNSPSLKIGLNLVFSLHIYWVVIYYNNDIRRMSAKLIR